MAPAPCDARWALEAFAAVSGVLPVRSLRTEAMQMDVIVAGSALPVREGAPANDALPSDRVRRQVQLTRARANVSAASRSAGESARAALSGGS